MRDLEPGSKDYQLIGACLRTVANLYPITAPDNDPTESHMLARCIETSKALIDLLKHFGIPAKPLPVDLNICNPAWYRAIQSGVPRDKMPEQAWALGVNQEEEEGPGWNGHLLVQVGRRWMMDPNAGQFNRPGRIRISKSWLWTYPRDLWTTDATAWDHFGMGDGIGPEHPEYALIFIRHRPDNTRYRRGTAWTTPLIGAFVEQAAKVINRLQEGTLPDQATMAHPSGDVVVDLAVLKRRWEEEEPDEESA